MLKLCVNIRLCLSPFCFCCLINMSTTKTTVCLFTEYELTIEFKKQWYKKFLTKYLNNKVGL